MTTTNYVLLSANHRYGVNLSQILMNHLLENGSTDSDGRLSVNFDVFAKDITTDLTFVLFNKPDQVIDSIHKFIKGEKLNDDTILGVSNVQDLHTNGEARISPEQYPDITYEANKADELRAKHRIINVDSQNSEIYDSLVFAPDEQLSAKINMDDIKKAIIFIEDQIRADIIVRNFYLIDKFRNVEPFITEVSEQTSRKYSDQAKHYKRILSLDSVELTRVNDADRKLYDQYQFRTQLNTSSDQAFELLEI